MKIKNVEGHPDLVAYLPDGYGFERVPDGATVTDGYSVRRTAPVGNGVWDLWHIATRERNIHVAYVWLPSGGETVTI